jgi:predicted transcriptional regulator
MEIIAQILQAANGNNSPSSGNGIAKTAIMYKAFLSYNQLKEYLSFLTERDLLQYDKAMQIFRLTEKGHRFLKIYNKIDDTTKISNFTPKF